MFLKVPGRLPETKLQATIYTTRITTNTHRSSDTTAAFDCSTYHKPIHIGGTFNGPMLLYHFVMARCQHNCRRKSRFLTNNTFKLNYISAGIISEAHGPAISRAACGHPWRLRQFARPAVALVLHPGRVKLSKATHPEHDEGHLAA